MTDNTSFIGYANRIDASGTKLDNFLDWVEDNTEYLAHDVVTPEVFCEKLDEYSRSL